jgi:hypothetical protein
MCGDRRVYRHFPERVLRQYRYVQAVPRHPSDVVELSLTEIVQAFVYFRTHTLKATNWGEHEGEHTWHMADGYVRWYTVLSHPQILPLLPRDILRPPKEEHIIAEQWKRYEARSSPDTYDMVSGVVAHADAFLGQEVMRITPQQLYAALHDVRQQIAPIITRRRGQRLRRRHQQHQQDLDQQ